MVARAADRGSPSAALAGVVLYAGNQVLPFGERLWALPLCALWDSE